MAVTKTEILNLALGHLAIGKEVGTFDSEKSEEAKTGRRYYDIALKTTLSAAPWPFATKIEALALIEEEPNTEWGFSYQYPANCIKMRRILSGVRNDSRQTRVPYKIAQGTQGRVMFSDEEDAQAEYTLSNSDAALYSQDFIEALSYKLAALMAPTLTAGDQFKLGREAQGVYLYLVGKASAHAFNEQQDEEPPQAEWITDRE